MTARWQHLAGECTWVLTDDTTIYARVPCSVVIMPANRVLLAETWGARLPDGILHSYCLKSEVAAQRVGGMITTLREMTDLYRDGAGF